MDGSEPDTIVLCASCKALGLETDGFNWILTKEQADQLGATFRGAHDPHNRRLITKGTIHNVFQTREDCPLCFLILVALQEQYEARDMEMWASHPYCLRWLYVARKVSRYDDFDGHYVRYIEVLSSANCQPEELMKGEFRFNERESKRVSVRSLIAPVAGKDGSPQTAALWAKFVPPKLDRSQVKHWMKCCDEWHGGRCKEQTGELEKVLPSSSFLVIDVENMCIATPSVPCRYIALSYVWGSNGENSFLTVKENIAELRAPGGLEKHFNALPVTIKDAITLVRELGERYLWVDSLCIIQDDVESKDANIASMADVYSGSTLTLVAATGNNANAGLPGVRDKSRNWIQRSARREKGAFVLLDDLELAVLNSPWITRGWTFQEWFFSSRTLVFVGGQALFSCRAATWREDIIAEVKPTNQGLSLNDVDFSYTSIGYELRPHRRWVLQYDLKTDIHLVLMMTLREYLDRKLTYDTDVLNAFSGILKDFGRALRSTVVMGSVMRFIDWVILFELNARGVERRPGFPSWTWCGWTGTPTWLLVNEIFDWSSYSTWIVWHNRGRESDSITEIPREVDIDWSTLVEDLDEDDDLSFALRMRFEQLKYKRPTAATRSTLPDSPLAIPIIANHCGYLQFWSMSATLRFEYPTKRGSMEIFDRDGDKCGSVTVDQPLVDAEHPRKCEIILLSDFTAIKEVGNTYVKKKNERNKREEEKRAATDLIQGSSAVLEEITETSTRKQRMIDGELNVMLVAWNLGIAERIGIGKIRTESVEFLEEPGLIWKEFILA